MFEKIISISKNYALVKIAGVVSEDLLNFNVVFEDDKKILGEIEEVDGENIKITFLGEFINGKFYSGIIRKPSLTAKIRIINTDTVSCFKIYLDRIKTD